jgi:hypothetical protein
VEAEEPRQVAVPMRADEREKRERFDEVQRDEKWEVGRLGITHVAKCRLPL